MSLLPLQVTTGSDAYSFGVLMWSLYMGQQPYVFSRSGVLLANPLFPHFPKFVYTAHPQYTSLAERCLRMDPHERPSFVEIEKGLLDFFDRECVAPGTPQLAPPTHSIEVPRPPPPSPAMSTPASAAGSDGLIQVGYVGSRHLLASCLSSAAASTQCQDQDAEGQALIRQLQQ